MRRDGLDQLAAFIGDLSPSEQQRTVKDELEDARLRQDRLRDEVDGLRTRLERSRTHIGLTAPQFRQTLSMSLRLARAPGIAEADRDGEQEPDTPRRFVFPADDHALASDSGWTATLDALRARRQRGESFGEWRRRAAIRPVTFEDTGRLGENAVQLHLEHRVARRLLGRFTAQGLVHHDSVQGLSDRGARCDPASRTARSARRLRTARCAPFTRRWCRSRHVGSIPNDARTRSRPTAGQASKRHWLPCRRHSTRPGKTAFRIKSGNVSRCRRKPISRISCRIWSTAQPTSPSRRKSRLTERSDAEKRSMIELLQRQRKRIAQTAGKDDRQLMLDFDQAERRQREADRRAWARRLKAIETELEIEPRRIADTYRVRAIRVDPIGLVYLWPRTG